MRIVLDTNVLISALVSSKGASAQILARCRTGEIELLTSPDSIDELRRVLTYPRIRKRLQYSEEQIDRFILFLEQAAIVVDTSTPMQAVTADADDDKFIALALAGDAQYIISGDDHLLSIGHYQGIEILKPAAFLLLWQTLKLDPPRD